MGTARLRDLVVLLPGITGSVLQKNGKDIWGTSARFFWDVASGGSDALRRLILTDDDSDVDDVGDGISAPRLIPDATIVPGLVKIDGYTAMAQMIKDGFRVEEGSIHDSKPANFIEFPYDWRRDNRAAARKLKALIDFRLPQWRKYSGAADAKLILLTHSMGGLIARHYLEVLEGWPDCRLLITLGTPFRGSLNALSFLANGYKQLTVDMTEPMRTFTSMYQLLPIYPAVRTGVTYRRVAEMDGIPGVVRTKAEDARQFHNNIIEAVDRHSKDSNYLEQGYRIMPVVGIRQPTNQSAELLSGKLAVGADLPNGYDPLLGEGDGTVPRLSAIPVELSDDFRQSFFSERHGSLQRNEAVLAHVRSIIEQAQIVGLKEIRGAEVDTRAAEFPALSITLDDLYAEGEPVRIRAGLVNMSASAGPPRATVQPIGGGQNIDLTFRPEQNGWIAEVVGLPAGAYRFEVRATAAMGSAPIPVHDLFEVVPALA